MMYVVVWPRGASVKPTPSASGSSIGNLNQGDKVMVSSDGIPDATDPHNPDKRWVKLDAGGYAASDYPNSAGEPQQRMVLYSEPVPAPEVVTVTVELNEDGVVYRGTMPLVKQ